MKLISVNIETNKHYDTVLGFLKKERGDVVCIQELLEEDFERFKKELGLDGVYQPFHYIESFPHLLDVAGKKQGVAIFSKSIIDSGYFFYNGKKENLSVSYEEVQESAGRNKNSVLVWADIKGDDGKSYKFINTHLPVTKRGESSPFQLEVVDKLLGKLKDIPEFVLCGDMNAPRGNETFSRLSKNYKDNIPKEYVTSLDKNLHRARKNPEEAKFVFTFMVDGLFTTPAYTASNVKLVDGVSDHMAVVADIQVAS